MLILCGGLLATVLLAAPPASAQTFTYTGGEQTYTVPAAATEIHVVAVGASGQGSSPAGGRGAIVTADLPVSGGTKFFVEVGADGAGCFLVCASTGFNGGAQPGGGGASDIRTASCGATCPGSSSSLASRLLVAGGGGGSWGGVSGGDAGMDGGGGGLGGEAGTLAHGGRGGSFTGTSLCNSGPGGDGSAGQGGVGWTGGGGGYYGGGGGTEQVTSIANNSCLFASGPIGGGGGGSSYVEPGAESVSYALDSTATPKVTITVRPVASTGPTIAGIAVQRQVLSDVHGAWAGGVSSYAYQWQRCDAAGADCLPIFAATSQTYAPSNADIGSTLRVRETAITPDGGSAAATSAPSGVVQPVTPIPAPAISGVAVQGQVLRETAGGWPGGPSVSGYQWERCGPGGGGCSLIGGATNHTYALNAADVGSTVRVTESVAYADGNAAAAASAPTSVVQPVAPARAVIVGPAHALVGTKQTYRASVTDSQGVPATYRWTIGGRPAGSHPTLTHTFSHPGHAVIVLQITDSSGNSFAATHSVRVSYPRLGVRVTWNATNAVPPSYSIFTALVAHAVPAGVHIDLSCGGRCPFAHHSLVVSATKHSGKPRSRNVDLTSLVAGDRLPIGTTLTIRFSQHAHIGEVEIFTIGAQGPARQTECLAPGSSRPGKGC